MTITIKGLPRKMHQNLKAQAKSNKRSLNREVLDILHRAVEPQPLDVQALLNEIDAVRARIKGPPLTDKVLHDAKNAGRP